MPGVALVVNRRVGGKVRQKRLGYLGSVTCSDGPISARERIRFWAAINQKFLAIRARRTEGISIADEERILAAIDSRIPRPREARQNRQSVERNGESAVPKTKTPLPGEGSGVRVINNSWRRETAPGNFTTSTDVKLDRLSAPGKRDGGDAREPLRR